MAAFRFYYYTIQSQTNANTVSNLSLIVLSAMLPKFHLILRFVTAALPTDYPYHRPTVSRTVG